MSGAELATATALARVIGIDPRTARSALDRAGVRPAAGQRYAAVEAEAAIRANLDDDKVLGHATSGRGSMEGGQFGDLATLSSAKRETERLRNERLQFDLDVKRGKFVPRDATMAAGADIIRRATFHFLAIGPRAAPRLVGMTDPAEIAAVLEDEARASLAELAGLDLVAEILG